MWKKIKDKIKKAYWFMKCLFGIDNVYDGSTCWYSRRFYNIHNYTIKKGGDGIPGDYFEFQCYKCGMKYKDKK